MYWSLNLLAFFLFYYKHYLSFFTKLHFLILTMLLFILFLKVIVLNLKSKYQLYFEYILIILLIITILPRYLNLTFILYEFEVLSNFPHKHCTSTREIFEAIQAISLFTVFALQVFLIYFSLPKDLTLTKLFQTFPVFFLEASTLLNYLKYLSNSFLFKQIEDSFLN